MVSNGVWLCICVCVCVCVCVRASVFEYETVPCVFLVPPSSLTLTLSRLPSILHRPALQDIRAGLCKACSAAAARERRQQQQQQQRKNRLSPHPLRKATAAHRGVYYRVRQQPWKNRGSRQEIIESDSSHGKSEASKRRRRARGRASGHCASSKASIVSRLSDAISMNQPTATRSSFASTASNSLGRAAAVGNVGGR